MHTTTVVAPNTANGKVNGSVPNALASPGTSSSTQSTSSGLDHQTKRVQERENLRNIIAQWNANRLDLFEISEPNEVSHVLFIKPQQYQYLLINSNGAYAVRYKVQNTSHTQTLQTRHRCGLNRANATAGIRLLQSYFPCISFHTLASPILPSTMSCVVCQQPKSFLLLLPSPRHLFWRLLQAGQQQAIAIAAKLASERLRASFIFRDCKCAPVIANVARIDGKLTCYIMVLVFASIMLSWVQVMGPSN